MLTLLGVGWSDFHSTGSEKADKSPTGEDEAAPAQEVIMIPKKDSDRWFQLYSELDDDRKKFFEMVSDTPVGLIIESGCPGSGETTTIALMILAIMSLPQWMWHYRKNGRKKAGSTLSQTWLPQTSPGKNQTGPTIPG